MMDNERVKIIISGITNIIVVMFIGAAWLLGKVTSTEALLPLLAVSGLELAGRKLHNSPPSGPTAAAVFMALQSLPTGLI